MLSLTNTEMGCYLYECEITVAEIKRKDVRSWSEGSLLFADIK